MDGSPPIAFDRDGLELAFKYFCSTTLTMRLAGITQINSHISLFNEMCNAESVVEVENVGLQLAGKENKQKKKYSNDTKDQKDKFYAQMLQTLLMHKLFRLVMFCQLFKRLKSKEV